MLTSRQIDFFLAIEEIEVYSMPDLSYTSLPVDRGLAWRTVPLLNILIQQKYIYIHMYTFVISKEIHASHPEPDQNDISDGLNGSGTLKLYKYLCLFLSFAYILISTFSSNLYCTYFRISVSALYCNFFSFFWTLWV